MGHSIVILKQQKQQTRQPRQLDDAIVDTSLEHQEAPPINCSKHFKLTFYYAVLDAFLSELKKQFDSKNLQIMKSVQACSPQSISLLQSDDLSGLIEAYGVDADAVAVEAPLARAALRGKEMESIGDVLCELAPLKVACLIKVVHIALTLAITSATCKHSFSFNYDRTKTVTE